MWNDEIIIYTAPHKDQYPDSFFNYTLHRAKVRFYRGEWLYLCVSDASDVDWTGQEVVMGYCGYSTNVTGAQKPWQRGLLGNSFERWALDIQGRYSKFFKLDRSADPGAEAHFRRMVAEPVFDEYFAGLAEEHRTVKRDQHWELEILGTHPDFRRRGVGKVMLEEGFRRARVDGVPLVLVASVMGEKLYLNAGFREVNRIPMLPGDEGANDRLKELDLGMGKGKGLSWACMVWEPESMGENRNALSKT